MRKSILGGEDREWSQTVAVVDRDYNTGVEEGGKEGGKYMKRGVFHSVSSGLVGGLRLQAGT